MKLKARKINALFGALMSLQTRTRVIESDGKAVNAANETFTFPTTTKTNIIRNIIVLRPFVDKFNDDTKTLIATLSPEGGAKAIDTDAELSAQFTKLNNGLLDTEQNVKGLLLLNWADLDVAKVDPVTISNLDFLVRGLPAADDKDLVPETSAPIAS